MPAERVEISQPVDPLHFDFNRLWPKAAQLPGYQDWLANVEMLTTAFCELFGRRAAAPPIVDPRYGVSGGNS